MLKTTMAIRTPRSDSPHRCAIAAHTPPITLRRRLREKVAVGLSDGLTPVRNLFAFRMKEVTSPIKPKIPDGIVKIAPQAKDYQDTYR